MALTFMEDYQAVVLLSNLLGFRVVLPLTCVLVCLAVICGMPFKSDIAMLVWSGEAGGQ